MDYYWSLFNNSNHNSSAATSSVGVGGHSSSNCSNNHAWESCRELGGNINTNMNSSITPYNPLFYHGPSTSAARQMEASSLHALMVHQQEKNNGSREQSSPSSLCLGKGSHHYKPDPHLMCLKLGKRHYFEDVSPLLGDRHVAVGGPAASSLTKKGKLNDPSWVKPSATPPMAVVPKCQVEGCETVLVNAKDYHRRHKVCEMHAKASKVVVLGIEQRFCQQCSRFHTVGEFDETKRSCRRRLAGHNERRRKNSQEHSLAKKSAQEIKLMGANRYPPQYLIQNSSDCALSLLSSTNNNPCWNISTSTDLPARCSAALRDLIAENRASNLGCTKQRQQQLNFNLMEEYFCKQNVSNPPRFLSSQQTGSGHLTLDLMQAPDPPSSAFGMLSVHDNSNNSYNKSSKEGSDLQECPDELWKLPLGY